MPRSANDVAGQRNILFAALKLYYFNVPEEYPVGPDR